jgi:hypothetical protein
MPDEDVSDCVFMLRTLAKAGAYDDADHTLSALESITLAAKATAEQFGQRHD